MMRRGLAAKWALGLLLAAGASVAFVQDFSALKGGSSRTGKNSLPIPSGPGAANLRWWTPNLNDGVQASVLVRDNLSPSQVNTVGTWITPNQEDEARQSYYPQFVSTLEDDFSGDDTLQAALSGGAYPAAYRYATTVPSAPGDDPRVKSNGGDPTNIHTWLIQPADPTERVSRNYALFVYLPIGPTFDPIGGTSLFPQRYHVYEIIYGGSKVWIDVVDTYAGGTGWVRLGNGGRQTNRLFNYDGTTPIQIRLHNTVPRDSNGNLSDVPYTTLVYADAARAIPDQGSYSASPIIASLDPSNPGAEVRTVAAVNKNSTGVREGENVTIQTGVVTSYLFDNGTKRWSFTPAAESEEAVEQDNTSAGVVAQLPFVTSTAANNYRGTNYHSAPVDASDPISAPAVQYSPTLEDGDYEIYAWLPGSNNGVLFGRAVRYEVEEGGTLSSFDINQDAGGGWVRIGTRRFSHSSANRLRVYVTNASSDPGDAGRQSIADTIRFVGASNLAITSTPIQTRALVNYPGLGVVERSVVVVAAENGRIYCLDATGNPDGTTNIIWTYPSTPDANTTDPNADPSEDGGIAEMPRGFGLSSGLVERVNGRDFLYIGSSNGRVYCIEMEGRGDADFTTRKPGTTRRAWSYPSDFPSTVRASNLGAFNGSVAFTNAGGSPKIIVPAAQGRVYALDAVAGPNKTTDVEWTFPLLTQPTLGTIESTPAVEFDRVYVGTTVKTGDDRGRFYSLNAATGAVEWEFNGTGQWDPSGAFIGADDFISGPATVSAAIMGGGFPNMVFVANENRWISGLNADTGELLWTTNELSVGVQANLTFTPMIVRSNSGALETANTIMVPTSDGRLVGLYADPGKVNRFGTRRNWEYVMAGDQMVASAAVGRGWMSIGDSSGYLYNYNNGTGYISPGNPPGQETVTENNPIGNIFRDAQIKFVTKEQYNRLRSPDQSAQLYTYSQFRALPEFTKPENAWEWGETMYMVVWRFPYLRNPATNPPPIINYAFSVEGANIRNISIESRRFRMPDPGIEQIVDTISGQAYDLDGFVVLAFTLQGGGNNALPPGVGQVQISVNTSSLNGQPQNIVPNPVNSRRDFRILNPIALVMRYLANGTVDTARQIGHSVSGADPGTHINGTADVPGTPSNEALLGTSAGLISHGRSGSSVVGIVDRSMMTLLRGPGRGLDNVRVSRSDLQWVGGTTAVVKPLDSGAFPNFEDLPVNFPNDSLDYPNIRRERLKVTKDLFGQAENPLFNAVTLTPPNNVDENNPLARVLIGTPFDLNVEVPTFQPPNLSAMTDSAGATLDGGYGAYLEVFVDSDGDGRRTRFGSRREAFRSFNLGTSVQVDERVEVTTPNVNLGSLAAGTGFDPMAPWMGTSYSPYTGAFQSLFKAFTVRNPGNVNLTNLRLAKGTDTGGAVTSWGVWAAGNHERAWLDTLYHLHSDIDSRFAFTGSVMLQKPRVEDRLPTELSINPRRRDNPNLGVVSSLLDASQPNLERAPTVSVSLPIGFPVGEYSALMRVIEDRNNNESLRVDGSGLGLEPFSDPTFVLNFRSRETRLTNSFTPGTATMIDDPSVLGTGSTNFLHQNAQPSMVRTLSGSLAVAFSSNRPAWLSTQPLNASTNDESRIYVTNLVGATPGGGLGSSPLSDLNAFAPNSPARWFSQQVGPYPTQPLDTLFNTGGGESVVAGTGKFGWPVFPALGFVNPYSGATETTAYMAFIGTAQKQTATRRLDESRLFIAPYQNGNLGAPVGLNFDPEINKGKPSVVQVGNEATVFFASSGSGKAQINYAHFNGATWGNVSRLDVGKGFESASQPAAFPRLYQGAGTNPTAGDRLIELVFNGKLQGRPHSDVWLGRMVANGNGSVNRLVYFPRRNQETLENEGNGIFRARGVSFDARGLIRLDLDQNGVVTNLEVPNTREFDQQTGLITFTSTLGGKVTIDPHIGTVRMNSAPLNRNARVLLTYTARFLRLNAGGQTGSHTTPSLVFDERLIGDFSYWARQSNTAIQPADQVRPGRFVVTYNRAAGGAGQTARSYMQTFRFAVQLPTGVHTQANGAVTSINVNGATSFYQVDPANGRIYFTAADEGRTISVTYTGVDEANGTPIAGLTVNNAVVSLRTERLEAPVPIEQAVNESQMTTFLDPFDNVNPNARRPGLIWLIWTSTRGSSSDIFFQTIAPRFTPVPLGR